MPAPEHRIWIELQEPKDAADAKQICDKVNRMIDRLRKPEDQKIAADWRFYWSDHERSYCYGGDMGYETLPDGGRWFSLDYFGRE